MNTWPSAQARPSSDSYPRLQDGEIKVRPLSKNHLWLKSGPGPYSLIKLLPGGISSDATAVT